MLAADLADLRLHWQEDGDPDGVPVVFANSLGCDLRLWDAVVARMPPELRLIRHDMRGHGLSDCPAGPYSMDMLVADAAALLDHAGVRSGVFVGLSIGGLVAQGLAAARPDLVGALVLSNTAARIGTAEAWRARIATVRSGGIAALVDGVLERWFTPGFRATADFALWRNMLLRTPAEGYAGCCAALAAADFTATTAALRLPAMAIAGAEDGSTPPDLVRATAALIDGAGTHVIEGAGHLPCVEAPDAYAAHLLRFLEETGHV